MSRAIRRARRLAKLRPFLVADTGTKYTAALAAVWNASVDLARRVLEQAAVVTRKTGERGGGGP